jgi:predicted metalloprotease with PDZ domain
MSASNKKQQKKQHIRFDDKDEKEKKEKIEKGKNVAKTEATRLVPVLPTRKPELHKILNVTLARNLNKGDNSFGFSLKGDTSDKSIEPHIDCVQPNSPAYRVGLQSNDKIMQVNGTHVASYPINKLIEQIDYETKLNPFKLNLVVLRRLNQVENSNETFSSSSENSSNLTNCKRTRCNYANLFLF